MGNTQSKLVIPYDDFLSDFFHDKIIKLNQEKYKYNNIKKKQDGSRKDITKEKNTK